MNSVAGPSPAPTQFDKDAMAIVYRRPPGIVRRTSTHRARRSTDSLDRTESDSEKKKGGALESVRPSS
jgi:hypothetical protein